MGRPPTKPITLKDGFYIEVKNKLDRSGIKMRRDTEEQMLQMIEDYKKSKVVVVLGESINGKWVNDIKKKKKIKPKSKKMVVKKDIKKK